MKHLNNPYVEVLGESAVSPPVCLPVTLTPSTLSYDAYIGTAFTGTRSAGGSSPFTYAITSGTLPTGLTLNTTDGTISGTPSGTTGTRTTVITVSHTCGVDTVSQTLNWTVRSDNGTYNQRAGNFVYADAPAAAPTFTADMFLGLDARYTEVYKYTSGPGWVGSTITFPAQAGARQVIWLSDSVVGAGRTFMVGGFPLALDPAANTPIQSLTINGVPGKVYFTSGQNTGGYTLNLT